MDKKEYFYCQQNIPEYKKKSHWGYYAWVFLLLFKIFFHFTQLQFPTSPSLRSPPLSHPLLGEGKTFLEESTKSGIPSWMSAFLKIIIGIVKYMAFLAPLKNIENNNFQNTPKLAVPSSFHDLKATSLVYWVLILLLLPLFSPKRTLHCCT